MSNQENILMMDGNGNMKNSNGNIIAKGVMIKAGLRLSTPSIEDLVKRIESLEKQLASMQLTSCELDVINKELRKNALLIENLKLTLTSTKDKI